LRSRTRIRRFRGHRVLFSCFDLPDSFSTLEGASAPVFMFYAPGLIFGGTEGDESRFHILLSRTHFWQYRGRRVLFSCLAHPDSFSRFRGRQIQFSCFALPNTFSALPWASCHFFIFCACELVFGGTEGDGSRFHVLLSRTGSRWYLGRRCSFHVLRSRIHILWYRGCRVPFSCIALSNSFSSVPRASSLLFMLFAPRLVFGGTEGIESHFHVLCSKSRFRRLRGRRV
jgi:hypothetical protein